MKITDVEVRESARLVRPRAVPDCLSMNEFVEEVDTMLWTMVIVLLFFWVLGVATSHTMSGFIHILYALAMVAAVVRIIRKRGVV